MNKSIAQIVGAAAEGPAALGLAPRRGGTDFIDRAHRPNSCWPPRCFWDLPDFPDFAANRSRRGGPLQGRQFIHREDCSTWQIEAIIPKFAQGWNHGQTA